MKKTHNFDLRVIIIGVISLAILFFVGLHNFYKNKCLFFNTTLIDILNLIFMAIFTYYLVELKSDKRKKQECIEDFIRKIQSMLDDKRFYKIDSEESLEYIRLIQRSVKSKIEVLKKFQDDNLIQDINYIQQQFDEYWQIVSDNINNISNLAILNNTLYRHINNMQNKLDQIIVEFLY